ncbi:hypothetical protein BGZ65_001402 [Modicella reniformis]|uniref:Uncharacterized protein n=1 Tax=Modicella reniformis TaxID=1440133 RepID=A0A9P6MIU1_9FUNG|nr:hypothetical protein BGZ65_001402 [Modicella reniformis]
MSAGDEAEDTGPDDEKDNVDDTDLELGETEAPSTDCGHYEQCPSSHWQGGDVKDSFGESLTSVTIPVENKQAIFAAFFDLLNRFKIDAYNELQASWEEVRKDREELNRKENDLRTLRRELYYYNKLDKAPKTPSGNTRSGQTITKTKPNWSHFTVEDDVQHLDISDLIADDSADRQGRVVFSGTDYGLCKMSETVALTRRQLYEHLITSPSYLVNLLSD